MSLFFKHLGLLFRLFVCHFRFNGHRWLVKACICAVFFALLSLVAYIKTKEYEHFATVWVTAMSKTPTEELKGYILGLQQKPNPADSWGEEKPDSVAIMVEKIKQLIFNIQPVRVFEDPEHPWPAGVDDALLKIHDQVVRHQPLPSDEKALQNIDSIAMVGWVKNDVLPGQGKWVIRHNLSVEKYSELSNALVSLSDGPRKAWYWSQVKKDPNHPFVAGFYQSRLGGFKDFHLPKFSDVTLLLIGAILFFFYFTFSGGFVATWERKRVNGRLKDFLQYPTPMWIDYGSELLRNTLLFFLAVFTSGYSILWASGEYTVGLSLSLGIGIIASLGLMMVGLLALILILFCYSKWVRRSLLGLGALVLFQLPMFYLIRMAELIRDKGVVETAQRLNYKTLSSNLWQHAWSIIGLEVLLIVFLFWILNFFIQRKHFVLD